MRILIDATPLLLRSAGVKTYTYYWIQHLFHYAGNEQILTYPRVRSLNALNHEGSMLGSSETWSHLGKLYLMNCGLLPRNWVTRKTDVFHVRSEERRVGK